MLTREDFPEPSDATGHSQNATEDAD
jgi:hypothetical protein